jgi:hypothetical protein
VSEIVSKGAVSEGSRDPEVVSKLEGEIKILRDKLVTVMGTKLSAENALKVSGSTWTVSQIVQYTLIGRVHDRKADDLGRYRFSFDSLPSPFLYTLLI